MYSVSDWADVRRNVDLRWDLEGTPLQLKTDSELGSNEVIKMSIRKESSGIGNNNTFMASWPSQLRLNPTSIDAIAVNTIIIFNFQQVS